MTKEELKIEAEKELINIIEFATDEEFERLRNSVILKSIDLKSVWSCIYGVMAGRCTSYRANEIKQECSIGLLFDGRMTCLEEFGYKFSGETIELLNKHVVSW